ncbi:MAG: hypothetical protein AAGI48_00460 [Verrucomicrobiota bacterium]
MPQPQDPFAHLDPTLWRVTRGMHIFLFILGTLLVFPASHGFYILSNYARYGLWSLGREGSLGIASFSIIASSGIITWSGLGTLFFKRNDLRWHLIVWRSCTVFGSVGFLPSLAWYAHLSEFAPSARDYSIWPALIYHGLFWLILTSSLMALVCGLRYARLAKGKLKAIQESPVSSAS